MDAPPDTRQKLIAAAIGLFGQKGREGVSTRQIATKAGVNIAGIAYHFGGKEQLHLACAEHIAETVQAGIAASLASLDSEMSGIQRLEATAAAIAGFMLGSPGHAAFARFVLREQMDPSPAFDVLYTKVMEPLHKRLCALWAEASGEPAESDATKVKVFGLISQVMIFRMAEAGAKRRMDWQALGPAEIALITGNVNTTIRALIEHRGRAS